MIQSHQHYDLLGKVVLERVVFTPPLRLKEQMESEACLLYSIKGNSALYHVNKKYDIKSHNGVLMKCGNYFNYWQENADNSENEAVAIHLYPELIKYVYNDKIPDFLTDKSNQKDSKIQVIKSNELLKLYIEGLMIYFNNPDIVDEDLIVLKVKELLNILYKLDSNNIRNLLHDIFNPSNVHFKNIIGNNVFEDISIEEIAHLCNLSISSFKRKFKESFNDTPASYFKNKKLEKATQLLTVSSDRILDISIDCGFSSVDSFSKSFKKKYGLSPTEFRQNDGLN
ncbi:Helix-turn-helix domain-containing protein [Tenacibaculum sp. MAR_2009_124]|uniref:helix-turn-helix domain-containing protein n=1 Tax=Tenacibaculum sp. MAR_2009_124 TaxID=1250059 RepID=UPI000896A92A|nr:AraC family transcriptional regulator [Tenacibaculum sp. MAR_2009_124]SEB40425.1 Helix-turn-helix domain-containing protein [Tenacibaculum sp. MAR_2009_124]